MAQRKTDIFWTKTMIVVLLGAWLALFTLAVGGCAPKTINAEALDGVMHPVLDRHDEYVQEDVGLTEVERSTFLRSSELIRAMVEEALDTPVQSPPQ